MDMEFTDILTDTILWVGSSDEDSDNPGDILFRWREVPIRPPSCVRSIDERGAQLLHAHQCMVCGELTVRYDTIRMEPRHWFCRNKEITNGSTAS